MKIMCMKNTAKDLDLKEVTTILYNGYPYRLIVGQEYVVMGMVIYKDTNCLYYLIDSDGFPDWYPYMLFEITNNKLPTDWYIRVMGKIGDSVLHTLMGFKELSTEKGFHDALMEREEYALQIYFKRKEEIFYDYFG